MAIGLNIRKAYSIKDYKSIEHKKNIILCEQSMFKTSYYFGEFEIHFEVAAYNLILNSVKHGVNFFPVLHIYNNIPTLTDT